jgi:hypothetical protein
MTKNASTATASAPALHDTLSASSTPRIRVARGGTPAAGTARTPTIFIPVPFAVNVRDILRSSILSSLKSAGAKVVILSPAYQDPEFVREFADDKVVLEPLHPHQPGKAERRLDTFRFTLFSDLTHTVGFQTRPVHARGPLKRALVYGANHVTRLLGQRRTERVLAGANLTLFPDHQYGDLFRRHRPDLICLTRVFGQASDYPVLKRAVQEGVPTVLVVSSWDNLTSKGVFPARVDRLVVWNSIMADEAVELHGFDRSDVFVAGVPQFDVYADKSELPDRTTFLRRVGADPKKALITFALTNSYSCPDEFDVLEMLWKAIRAGALGRPCQLLARIHPLAKTLGEAFPDRLRGLPDLLVDTPGRDTVYVDRDASLDDLKHLAATMWHSDVVINTCSTIAIDAAAFDTPVVCAAFDGYRTLPYDQSVRRFHDFTHFKKLLEIGGVRVAHGLDQLVGFLKTYLADRNVDSDLRAKIVERQCAPIDGRAGERIADLLLRSVSDLGPRRRTPRWAGRL